MQLQVKWHSFGFTKVKVNPYITTFLKKKKITPTHSQAICDAVGQYNRNIVEFNESHQSFFKIMTYYYPTIGMIPEDVQYLELRRQLFDFVMKNAEYTKVNSKALIQ